MVKIIADTLSSITVNQAQELGIFLLPQIVIFGDESYRDDTEMDPDTFVERLKISPSLPKTTAPYPSLYKPILDTLIAANEDIIIICPTSKMSGTYSRAIVAANEYEYEKIKVIDTPLLGAGLGTLVRMAVNWASEGLKSAEIEEKILIKAQNNRTYFLVETLEYLQKGGRIGAAKALLGSVLQVKPLLSIVEGQVSAIDSQRTHKKALSKFIERVVEECPKEESAFLNVQHGGAYEQALSLAQVLSQRTGLKNIPISDLPSAILVHGGPGVLGVSFFATLE